MFIQSALFFVLGIAVTLFVTMLIAPIIWRRALYLAKKALATEIPLSITEIEADLDFLKSRHAIEIVKRDEKYNDLFSKYNAQKLELGIANEQLSGKFELERQLNQLKDKLSDTYDELVVERQLVDKLGNNEKRGIRELRNILLNERRDDIDRNKYEAEIKSLQEEITYLKQELEQATVKQATTGIEQEQIEKLRNEILDFTARMTADVAKKEGKDSPINKLIKEPHSPTSLAARIEANLAETEKDTKVKPKKTRTRSKQVSKNTTKPA